MRVLILGGDGYLGWPTAMHFSEQGHDVLVVDNFCKRRIELEEGVEPLWHTAPLHKRVKLWNEVSGKTMQMRVADLMDHRAIYRTVRDFKPDAIVHYAEQPSAPYSMHSRPNAVFTQQNNIIGTLNLVFAIQAECPDAHLIKLGTMGEYGTPDIDIEEGYITIEHNGRSDTLPFPKQPFSFYHLSKVADSYNLQFCARNWRMRVTDLNQGVVYGIETDETTLHPEFITSFHYDDIFGTVLNRFCVQAVCGKPLTVYGKGGQTRGFLNIRDTIQCIDIATQNPADPGEFRVMNQFTETFSVLQLAEMVRDAGAAAGLDVEIAHLPNPRVEKEEHYYNAKNDKLKALGLQPRLLSDVLINDMISKLVSMKDQVDQDTFTPRVRWKQ